MVTRDEVNVGDFIINNDPRKPGQAHKIEAIYQIASDWFAEYRAGRRRARVRFDRIYKQGTKGPTNGWTLATATQ